MQCIEAEEMSGELRPYRALIWDMDGTLLNTLDDIIGACNDTLEAYGLPTLPKPEMLQLIGYGAHHLCQGASGLDGEALDRFQKDYRARAISRDDPKTYIYPGVAETLRWARAQGIYLGIYTNKPQAWCTKLADKFFGAGMFDTILGSTEEGLLKPDPEGIWRMCRGWGIEAESAVMIGDQTVDFETAERAGSQHVCVSWGFRARGVLEAAGARVIVDDFEALARVLGMR